MLRWTVASRPIFRSSNDWGIPDLLPAAPVLPLRTAIRAEESGPGSLAIDRTLKPRAGSTIGFWVDDYRIEPLWSRPWQSLRRLLVHRPAALIAPDFSVYVEHPLAVAVWNLYRSRWLARWWQEQGIAVIPQLSWNARTFDLVDCGIPRGAAVAIEGRPRFKDPGLFLEGLTRGIETIRPQAVLLYGCPEALAARLPSGPRYLWLPAWSPKRRMAQ